MYVIDWPVGYEILEPLPQARLQPNTIIMT